MRAAVLVVMLGGCARVLGLDDIPPYVPSTIDAALTCTKTRDPADDFTGPMACNPWASATRSFADLTSGSGMLVIAPQTGQALTYAGCTENGTAAFAPGMSIEVAQVFGASSGYVTFHAYSGDSGVGGVLTESYGKLGLTDPATGILAKEVTYDPAAMRWWRLRPDPSGTVGEVSADGVSWTSIGTVPGTPAQQVRLDFGAGTTAPETTPGMTIYRHLNETCM